MMAGSWIDITMFVGIYAAVIAVSLWATYSKWDPFE